MAVPPPGDTTVKLPRFLQTTVLCLAVVLTACAPVPATGPDTMALDCPARFGPPLLIFQLYMGRSMPPFGEVTDADWDAFVDRVVTPALPNGFTTFDANGGWMSPASGKTIRERTKVLMTALPNAPDSIAKVKQIRNDYQVKFHQQVVGMTVSPACGSF
jgi:hypothetical protein